MRTPIKEKDLVPGQVVYDTDHENGIPIEYIRTKDGVTYFDPLDSKVYPANKEGLLNFPAGINETWYIPMEGDEYYNPPQKEYEVTSN